MEESANSAMLAARTKWNVDDVINAIEWTLARDPEFGALLNERGIRGFISRGARSINEPDISVIYEDRDPHIIIHHLEFSEARAPYAGHA